MHVRRWRRLISAVIGCALTVGLLTAAPIASVAAPTTSATSRSAVASATGTAAAGAAALSGSQFNPGYIISDANFYDRYAMTEAEIQNFLNSMIGSTSAGQCQNSNCLAVKMTPTFPRAADAVCRAYEPRPDGQPETTAAIIFKVQQACGISARVLLVTLQKEQSLLTNPAPTDSRLARAMGYGCPDNTGGTCDALYNGLYNQLYSAGRQLVRYSNPPGTSNYFTWYPVGRASNILYHPNSAMCGASPVVVQNHATAALYYYTPYQPNAAALANLGRTGDACSSYGNRNFWYYYSLWFGDPTKPRGAAYGQITEAVGTPAGIRLSGWAVIPESLSSRVQLAVEIAGAWTPLVADQPTALHLSEFPTADENHGFSVTIPAATGNRGFCLWGVGLSTSSVIECRTVNVPLAPSPIGAITTANGVPGGIAVEGWSVQPGSPTASVSLALNVGQQWTAVVADQSGSPEADQAVPGAGSNHRFATVVPAGPGPQRVCVWAAGVAGAVELGCRTVTVPGPAAPDGRITAVTTAPGSFTVTGWAVQAGSPTTTVQLAINIGSRWIPVSADLADTEAPTVHPGIGGQHGFRATITAATGTQSFCVWAAGPAGAVNLGCRSVVVPAAAQPDGAITAISPTASGFTVDGWVVQPGALDAKVELALNIGGRWIPLRADRPGATAAEAAYPGAGSDHGFSVTVPAVPGTHSFCMWAVGLSGSSVLECGSVTVSSVPPPAGRIVEAVGVPGGIRISGWMVLPSSLTTKAPMAVNVGSRWIAVIADQPGATAAEAAYPGAGTDHAFSAVIPAARGTQSFCLWVAGAASTAIFECRSVVVP